MADNKEERLVWVDLEMSGLDIKKDHILEMACLVTSGNLDIVAEGPNLIINQPDSVLESMGDWCKQHHGQSGLTEAVRKSNVSLESAEQQMLQFVQQYTVSKSAILSGNSVHADKVFLDKFMPHFMAHLHYRIVDVTSVKEICRRWYPEVFKKAPPKKVSHRALDDIKESIEELRFYKSSIFK
ncbi:oligoribonuclease, mitochondrial-like [Mizuhopecten yessoensis]|uniref:Oligoribonuclease, mitochondrial n=1 Tax=Mizuhopecten yessoensis TaxID=6573 RepID=A0A210PY91_MIZYE|nr:oligoribonuclease, mitochondrial-like [Mizuhopecten yessoensis]OWF41451.1 Oligoribonuclease, mitochondrial [Mizuhopecten yessoensis]